MLHLWAGNVAESELSVVLTWAVIAEAVSGAVFGLAFLACRRLDRAAAFALVVVTPLFLFGHLCNTLWRWKISSEPGTVHLVAGLVFGAGVAGAAAWLLRTRLDLSRGLSALGAMLLVFCVITGFNGARGFFARYSAEVRKAMAIVRGRLEEPVPISRAPEREERPDIYYIILDGYARHDVLRKHFGVDNSPFLDALRAKGFVVPERSRANYPATFLSLSSSLNMTYLDDVFEALDTHKDERLPFVAYTRGNRASRFLKSKGYTYATILTHYSATERSDTADVTFAYSPELIRGEYSKVLMQATLARLWETKAAPQHLFGLDAVRRAAALAKPTFMFAHILLPHPPYVFDRHGNVRRNVPLSLRIEETRPDGYVDQMLYLNGRVLELVDHLLASAPTPPVIILQGDHGWVSPTTPKSKGDDGRLAAAEQLMPNLTAVYAPENVRRRIHPEITPVNMFRILLSELFGADLPNLPDRSYMYDRGAPRWETFDVTEHVRAAWP